MGCVDVLDVILFIYSETVENLGVPKNQTLVKCEIHSIEVNFLCSHQKLHPLRQAQPRKEDGPLLAGASCMCPAVEGDGYVSNWATGSLSDITLSSSLTHLTTSVVFQRRKTSSSPKPCRQILAIEFTANATP